MKKYGGALREEKKDKLDYTLLPLEMLDLLVKHYTTGSVTHGPWNWISGDREFMEGCRKSAWRHFIAWEKGEIDEDHLSACIFNMWGYEVLKNKLDG